MLPFLVHRDRWPLALLILLPLVWWHPLLLGFLPDYMDTVTLQYPLRLAAARQLWQGTLPLWAPEIMSGVPLMANPEVSVWYPPNWLFFLVPGPRAYGLVALFHYWVGGVGALFLCRRVGCSRPAALFGALTFQFGSFMISHIALLPLAFAMSWTLWIVWAVEGDCRNHSERWISRPALLATFFLACHLLAGALQMAYYSILAMTLYWGIRFVGLHGPKRLPVCFAKVAFVGVMAFGLVAVQIVPTLEFIGATERAGGLAVEKIREQALNGGYVWRALVGYTGHPIEDTDTLHAIGLGALAMVPLAFVRRRTRGVAVALMAVGVFGYLLALGALVPLWARVLPHYASLHAPRRALVLWSLVGPVVAALGLHNLLVWFRMRRRSRGSRTAPGPVRFSPLPPVIVLAVLLIPNALMLPRLERKFASPERFHPGDAALGVLREGRYFTLDPTLNYAHGSRSEDYGATMLPNLAAWHDMRDIQGYCSLVLRRYGEARRLASRRSGVFYPSHSALFTDPASPVLRLLHVRHLIGRFDLFDPSVVIPGAGIDREAVAALVEPALDRERWPVWRYREAPPLAWLPEACLVAETSERALAQAAWRADPYRVAFADLQDPPRRSDPARARALAPLEIARVMAPDARRWRIEFTQPVAEPDGRLVVLSSTWMRGWTGRASGGERLETFPVNGINTAVVAPRGATAVELVYRPFSFRSGGVLTLLALTLSGVFWVRFGARVPGGPHIGFDTAKTAPRL